MRHAPRLPGTPGQTCYGVCGLALVTVLFLAWLALQPQAAPLPTGPVLPGFSAACAQLHVQALAQAPHPAGLPPPLPLTGTTVSADVLRFR
jgi:hypothetical protein